MKSDGWSMSRDENRGDRSIVTRLVKVLEIERVIPHLIDRSFTVQRLAHFELDGEHDAGSQEDHVDAPPHAGDAEFEIDRALEGAQPFAQKIDLNEPRVFLRQYVVEATVLRDRAENRFSRCRAEIID